MVRIAAMIPEDRTLERHLAKDFKQALELYDEAITLHAGPRELCQRANALDQLKRDAEAFADVRRAALQDRRDAISAACLIDATSASSRMASGRKACGGTSNAKSTWATRDSSNACRRSWTAKRRT